MGKKKKKHGLPKDPIKAMKKASRDIELEMGVRFTYNHPHKNKKLYNRKNKDWKNSILDYFSKKALYVYTNLYLHREALLARAESSIFYSRGFLIFD